MKHSIVTLVALLAACAGSSPEISTNLARQFALNSLSPIDLAQLGPSSWQTVCVLTPYTTNKQAQLVLGFKWDAEGKTSISSNDGVNVLVFVRGKEVIAYTEHPRNLGDLSQLKPRCLPRHSAKVVRRIGDHGWVYLVAQNAA